MRVMNIQYEKLASQARGILKDIKEQRLIVADLALKACTIKASGVDSGHYTVKQFADDIGLNERTLSGWIQERKVQITLQKKNIKVSNRKEIRAITKIIQNKVVPHKERPEKFNRSEIVMKAYKQVQKKSNEDSEIERMIQDVKRMKFKLSTYKISLLKKKQVNILKTLLMETLTHLVVIKENK